MESLTDKATTITPMFGERNDVVFDKKATYSLVGVSLLQDSPKNGETARTKKAQKEFEEAAAIAARLGEAFELAIDRMAAATSRVQAEAKTASSKVRQTAADLQSALAKVEQQANFQRLESYVLLLERAAAAMSTLAELDKSGKLTKVVAALK